tara:strand:+ start:6925 stop:7170 length:246 start_codon:yes stop_codon:yes gene_type:complete
MDGYSGKLQAASCKLQATSDKQKQAGSWKLEAKSLCLRLRKEQDLTPVARQTLTCSSGSTRWQLGCHTKPRLLAFGFWLLA